MKKKYMTGSEFDERFDAGEDLSPHYDLDNATRPCLEQRRVSVDFPVDGSQTGCDCATTGSYPPERYQSIYL